MDFEKPAQRPYDADTTGALQRIRASGLYRDDSGGLSPYRPDDEAAGGRALGAAVHGPTAEFEVVAVDQAPDTYTSADPQPEPPRAVVVGRHRLPEKVDHGRRMLAAVAVGCVASGSAMLYSQWPQLPQAWNTIVGFVERIAIAP